MSDDSFISTVLSDFGAVTKKPEAFLSLNEDTNKQIKSQLKNCYDYTKSEEAKTIKTDALPELIVDNFDIEQIWQQLELQNEGYLTRSLANISKLVVVGKSKLIFEEYGDTIDDTVDDEEEENTSGDDSSDDDDDVNLPPLNLDESDGDDISLNSNDLSDADGPQEDQNEKRKGKSSIVDDKFFKLDEMEAFLQAEEKKINDEDPDSGNDTESDDEDEKVGDEDDVDLFEGDSDDMETDHTERGKIRNPKYKDFFGEADVGDKEPKRNKFFEEQGDELEDENDMNRLRFQANGFENDDVKSSLELREERLKRKIGYLEEAAVSEKPWQLKGEVKADGRPQNSLLEEIVEFDLTSRPAPVITEQTSLLLEDVIRQRIKDKAFDSVERKQKPVETPLEYKKKLVLDQEKSKQSLAQIYEKEYLDQKEAMDPNSEDKEEEEPKLHQEIKVMMHGLFTKLDALSNLHFTPKQIAPELKIVSNLPAVAMEEVAPVTSSDAALLAPEEVKGKVRGDIIGANERTDTDKKRERRKKKDKQRKHANIQLKKQINNPGLGNKYSKEKAKKLLDEVTKDRNIDKMDESTGSKSVKSSAAFFTQLEEEVKSQIKSKTKLKNKGGNKSGLLAKKIKL